MAKVICSRYTWKLYSAIRFNVCFK